MGPGRAADHGLAAAGGGRGFGLLCGPWRYVAIVPLVVLAGRFVFPRSRRAIPADADAIVSPADGMIAEVTDVDHYDFLDGPAVRIGIFLSIFNVHINRAPRAASSACITSRASFLTP